MGDSAGGNLSTALPLKLRDLGEPMPRVIVPISPWYDMECVDGTIDSNVETDALIGREAILGLVGMIYANEDAKSPLVQVLNADPKGLPPMYIVVGGYETLRDNGEKFYKKAVDAGVEAVLEVGEGQQHVSGQDHVLSICLLGTAQGLARRRVPQTLSNELIPYVQILLWPEILTAILGVHIHGWQRQECGQDDRERRQMAKREVCIMKVKMPALVLCHATVHIGATAAVRTPKCISRRFKQKSRKAGQTSSVADSRVRYCGIRPTIPATATTLSCAKLN